jgi:hypothetical protein
MGAHRSKGYKEGRTSKMHDTNRGGLDRHSDNGGSKLAMRRSPSETGGLIFASDCRETVPRKITGVWKPSTC